MIVSSMAPDLVSGCGAAGSSSRGDIVKAHLDKGPRRRMGVAEDLVLVVGELPQAGRTRRTPSPS